MSSLTLLPAPTEETPAANPALEYLSASRLSCWQQCKRKHYFRYIARIPSQSSPALHLGKVVHATLQRLNHWKWRGEEYDTDALRSVLDNAWDRELQENPVAWKSDKEVLDTRDKAWELILAYLDSDVEGMDAPITGVEVRLDAHFDGLPPLVGVLDLVHGDGRIVDYKTAAKSPSEESIGHQHSTQLGVYSMLYRACTGEPESGLELHHLVKTKVPKVCVSQLPPATDEVIANTRELMQRHVQAVESGDFTCSPSFLCSGCEYLAECKAWKGATA